MKKIAKAIEESKDIIQYLKDEKVELSDKFNFDKINKNDDIYQKWNSQLLVLLKIRNQIEQLDKKLIELKSNYSGKNKKYRYLEFIEKISFNEDEIVDNIQNSLIDYRKELVKINEEISKITEKELKLLDLDYERLIIMSSED